MKLVVLGAGAGGGVPQWNCGCDNCREARSGSGRVRPRTQDSIAVREDGEATTLFNASPDLLLQIERTPALHPQGRRGSPIAGVVLTNGDLDHVLGLLLLRESTPFVLYATESVYSGLWKANAFFRTLERFPDQVRWERIAIGRPFDLPGGLEVNAMALPGKVPKHLEGLQPASPEDNIGLVVRSRRTGGLVVYAPAFAALGPWCDALDGAAACFLDGTFWSADELVRQGLGTARAEDMAHLPIGGETGSLATLAARRVARKIYTHINNTNPVLVEGSDERRRIEEAGFDLASDGLEIVA